MDDPFLLIPLAAAAALVFGFALGWGAHGSAKRTKFLGKQRAGRRTVCQKEV